MEEVVAKRHNAAGAGYVFAILMGLLILIVGCVAGVKADEPGAIAIGVVVGLLLMAMGAYFLFRFFQIPAQAIVYRDGVLYLPRKVTCRPEELQKVFVKVYRSRYGAVSRYGKMELTVGGKVYKYNNIAEIKKAQDRLLELNHEAIERLSNQQPAEEQSSNT